MERDFATEGPDRLRVADITYISALAGFLRPVVVLAARSRRVIGWASATHARTDLVLDALDMAVTRRRPERVILHSEQGTQYMSVAFGLRGKKAACPSPGIRR